MQRRSLKYSAIGIAVVVLGVTLVNLIIKGLCYLLLAMFKYPMNTLLITVALMGIIFAADKFYNRSKNK